GANGLTGFVVAKTGEPTKTYYYRKNIQGDITHIYDVNGVLKARYTYDAWGNHIIDINEDGVGDLNPFRYRGYYYDVEIGLYYLNSRYYDSEVGRFVSPDNIEYLDLAKDYLNGLNLYAYCFNNPVNAADDGGDMPNWLKWTLGIVIIVAAVVLSVASAGLLTALLAPIGVAVGGGLLGAIVVGAVVGAVGGAIAGFGISIDMPHLVFSIKKMYP
ncbi:MAG: RHS repeat-associated core domain-containing protein, partial [Clostridiales bacterium]|nr:RHS repeat-associated core domain-containing protein [Clostridiales bacterium]